MPSRHDYRRSLVFTTLPSHEREEPVQVFNVGLCLFTQSRAMLFQLWVSRAVITPVSSFVT